MVLEQFLVPVMLQKATYYTTVLTGQCSYENNYLVVLYTAVPTSISVGSSGGAAELAADGDRPMRCMHAAADLAASSYIGRSAPSAPFADEADDALADCQFPTRGN